MGGGFRPKSSQNLASTGVFWPDGVHARPYEFLVETLVHRDSNIRQKIPRNPHVCDGVHTKLRLRTTSRLQCERGGILGLTSKGACLPSYRTNENVPPEPPGLHHFGYAGASLRPHFGPSWLLRRGVKSYPTLTQTHPPLRMERCGIDKYTYSQFWRTSSRASSGAVLIVATSGS